MVAGVIGRKNCNYDLCGEVVKLASRTEGEGESDAIETSAAKHALLKDDSVCIPAGKVLITGEGEVDVNQLIDEITSQPGCIDEACNADRQQLAHGELLQ